MTARDSSGAEQRFRGQVVFKSSRHVIVVHAGRRFRCELRGKLRSRGGNPIVVGDFVEVSAPRSTDGESSDPMPGRVESVLPRSSALSRKRRVGEARELILAANVDQVVAVFAAQRPRLKLGTLDRLLVAAAAQGLPAVIVLNKCDLEVPDELVSELPTYEALYPVLRVSALRGDALDEFRDAVAGKASVICGPSGVGKSSLLNALFPDLHIRVGAVSHANEKGRHTTTAATWYPFPGAGAAVDTPGFREYALWGLADRDIAGLMPDIAALGAGCRFLDCRHRSEPGCAVRAAVEAGLLSQRRYESYVRIVESVLEEAADESR